MKKSIHVFAIKSPVRLLLTVNLKILVMNISQLTFYRHFYFLVIFLVTLLLPPCSSLLIGIFHFITKIKINTKQYKYNFIRIIRQNIKLKNRGNRAYIPKALMIVKPSLKPPLVHVSVVFGIILLPIRAEALLRLISKTWPPVNTSIPTDKQL